MASVIALEGARLTGRRARPARRSATRSRAESLRVVADSSTTEVANRPTTRSLERLGRSDGNRLKVLAASFVIFGVIMVLSASSVVSIAEYGSPWALFERQVMWSVFGVVALVIGTKIEIRRLRRLSLPILVLTVLLLVAVLAPGIGKIAGGSSRWIGFGPIRIQPSEFAKLAFALFAADLFARREHLADHITEIVRPILIVVAFVGLLILKQPDMGTAIVLVCIAGSILYVGGIRRRLLAVSLGVVGLAGAVLSLSASYRRARLFSFINPFAHASTTGYQVVQSLVALGSGHLTGTGIGGSTATWGLLPNAQTDFIFAVIGNELGLVGAVLVLIAFACYGWLGMRIAARAADRFSSLLAVAITCWVVCQAFMNIGGVVGVLPETGIPLPFLSFGGSSLVVVLLATGILMNIARHPLATTESARSRSKTESARTRSKASAGSRAPTAGRARVS